jgi:hypothetical protein
MRCRCSEGKILCTEVGELDILVVTINNVGTIAVSCDKSVEEVRANAKLVIVERKGDKRIARVYV